MFNGRRLISKAVFFEQTYFTSNQEMLDNTDTTAFKSSKTQPNCCINVRKLNILAISSETIKFQQQQDETSRAFPFMIKSDILICSSACPVDALNCN